MKFNIQSRDGDGDNKLYNEAKKSSDGLIDLPDDLEGFLKVVTQHGRFDAIPPNKNWRGFLHSCPTHQDYWTLYFQEGYD